MQLYFKTQDQQQSEVQAPVHMQFLQSLCSDFHWPVNKAAKAGDTGIPVSFFVGIIFFWALGLDGIHPRLLIELAEVLTRLLSIIYW